MKKTIYTCDVCGELLSNEQSKRRCFICGRMMCPDDTFTINIGDKREICCRLCRDIGDKYVDDINDTIKHYHELKNDEVSKIVSKWRKTSNP